MTKKELKERVTEIENDIQTLLWEYNISIMDGDHGPDPVSWADLVKIAHQTNT